MSSTTKGSAESLVYKTVAEHSGLTAAQLTPHLPASISKKDLVAGLNSLISKDLVKVSRTNDNQLIWKAVEIGDAKAKNAMAGDERMVFSAIEASGNQGTSYGELEASSSYHEVFKGIWSRTITTQTNLPNAVVTKILSKLISAKQIKMVKSVKTPTRKMYMVSHIEPSVELTGGPWYTDFELDPTFIGYVREACLQFVRKKSFPDPEDNSPTAPLYSATNSDRYPTVEDIARFVKNAKITEVPLLPEHIEEIMNVLIYEGLVERLPGSSSSGDAARHSDDDMDLAVLPKQRKRKSKVAKRSETLEDDGSEAEERRKRRRKAGSKRRSDSESPGDSRSPRRKSKGRSGSKKHSASDSDGSEDERRGRRKHVSSDNSESDVGTSKRKRKSSKSLQELSEDETDAGGRGRSQTLSSSRRSSKSKIMDEDEDEDDLDLNDAFGHLLNGGSTYRAIRQEWIGLGWSQAPCERCPQMDFCEDDGPVNPVGCKYYSDWLAQPIEE